MPLAAARRRARGMFRPVFALVSRFHSAGRRCRPRAMLDDILKFTGVERGGRRSAGLADAPWGAPRPFRARIRIGARHA
jgi:hypothetical protein